MNKNKTGPQGKGPRTGRGLGDCPKPEGVDMQKPLKTQLGYFMNFKCHNCYESWEEGITCGTWLKEDYNDIKVIEDFASKHIRTITCPRCKTTKSITKVEK